MKACLAPINNKSINITDIVINMESPEHYLYKKAVVQFILVEINNYKYSPFVS